MGLCLFAYVFVNVAMVTGLVPVVGVPLPLISYGGTSMLTMMVGLGFVLNAHVKPLLAHPPRGAGASLVGASLPPAGQGAEGSVKGKRTSRAPQGS
jgi:hypothetical protein